MGKKVNLVFYKYKLETDISKRNDLPSWDLMI